MPSLVQLLASHHRIMVLDAASTRSAVGIVLENESPIWTITNGDASQGIFSGARQGLQSAAIRLEEIEAFVFCEGPGSMLGVRTVAMAIRTWLTLKSRPVYAYQSLALAARSEWTRQPRAVTIIADARRDTWHVQSVTSDGTLSSLTRVPTAKLPGEELLSPASFRNWTPLPGHVQTCAYDPAALFERTREDDLLHAVNGPDAFQHEDPTYKKWAPHAHSAETAPPRK